MALNQTHTDEHIIYTQTLREPTTDYLLRKTQTDRIKLFNLLNKLLQDREVIIFYDEHMVIAKQNVMIEAAPLPVIPEVTDRVGDQEFPGVAHVAFYIMPSYTPTLIELDMIKMFITQREGVDQIESIS